LYITLRIWGVIAFRYNFHRGRFEHSMIALTYSGLVVLLFFFVHPKYVAKYLEVAVFAYNNDLILETIRFNFYFSDTAFLLVYISQIWHRKEIVGFLNKGLNLLEHLEKSTIINHHMKDKYLTILTWVMYTSSFGFFYEGMSFGMNFFEVSVKTVLPYYVQLIFGATWTLLTSMSVQIIQKLNCQIIHSMETAPSADVMLKEIYYLYCHTYSLNRVLSRLSSVISAINIIYFFIGLATLVSILFYEFLQFISGYFFNL
jgi:hypothetical protein